MRRATAIWATTPSCSACFGNCEVVASSPKFVVLRAVRPLRRPSAEPSEPRHASPRRRRSRRSPAADTRRWVPPSRASHRRRRCPGRRRSMKRSSISSSATPPGGRDRTFDRRRRGHPMRTERTSVQRAPRRPSAAGSRWPPASARSRPRRQPDVTPQHRRHGVLRPPPLQASPGASASSRSGRRSMPRSAAPPRRARRRIAARRARRPPRPPDRARSPSAHREPIRRRSAPRRS